MSAGEFEIPDARVDDLDLDDPADRARWEERLQSLAARRIQQARHGLERMAIIRADGSLASDELTPDISPSSGASVDTG